MNNILNKIPGSLKKLLKLMFKSKLNTVISLVLIVASGYFISQKLNDSDGVVQYLTEKVERGNITVSVSGSGQVTILDEIDIKPKVSGDLVYINLKEDQEVSAGALLAQLDTSNAQRSISDAEIALESARINLEELLEPPDEQSLLQAENSLAQAERDLGKAEKTYNNIEADVEDTLITAYEDGYSEVSSSFFKLSDYVKDLKDVIGTEKNATEYIMAYENILGENSLLTEKLLDDYYDAKDLYNETFTFFREVFRNDDRETVYQLINDTLETAEAISQALESTRHMYDTITVKDYTQYTIASVITKMQSKIESDLSSVFSIISSLQKTINTIDDTVENAPDEIKDAELSFKSAQEKFEEKKQALEDLLEGADSLDIRTQENTVAQKEAALAEAQEKLANHYIKASFSGVISGVSDKVKIGDSVSSGTVLATLITKQKIVEITLNEVDIAKIKVGQQAVITFDAIDDLRVTGEVVEIDAVGTVTQGVVSYDVKISLDVQDERVKPGMSISTEIIVDTKQDVLIVSSSALKLGNNTQYLEVVENGAHSMRQVKTGISNDIMVEIVSGIEEGDEVVIQSVSSASTSKSSTNNSRSGGSGIRMFGM